MHPAGFRAGVSEARITPPVGMLLLGPVCRGTGVHDDLCARALVLQDGGRSIAIVCLDLVGLELAFSDELRAALKSRAGISAAFINCTHTHSAPFTIPWSVAGWRSFQEEGGQWREQLVETVVRVVNEAASGAREAILRVGRAPVQVGFNRRLPAVHGMTMGPNRHGAVVPWVDVLRIDSLDGRPFAVLFSHSAHPVIVHASSTLVSADYPGFAVNALRKELRRSLGDEAVALFAQGCAGNVNAEPLRKGFDAAEKAGRLLAEAALKAALESEPFEQPALGTALVTLELPLRDLPSQRECDMVLAEARNRLLQAEKSGIADEEQLWFLRDAVLCLQDLRKKAGLRDGSERRLRFEAGLVTFGKNLCILAMTHEVFAEYQLWADAVFPFRRTMVLAYTNGCESYVPTDRDFAMGGYEAASFPLLEAALRYPYRVALREGVEKLIKEALVNGVSTIR